MAKATTRVALTDAWVKISDAGVTFAFYIQSGGALLHYSELTPVSVLDDGELFVAGEHCGDTAPTQNAWMRGSAGFSLTPPVIILHKE